MSVSGHSFYGSKRWIHLRDNYAQSQDYICERCYRPCYTKDDERYRRLKKLGQDVQFGIVHHKQHLTRTTINDPLIALEWNNLELLCISCHNKEHHIKQPIEVREDVKFDERGRVIFDG